MRRPNSSTDGYAAQAAGLVAQYESISFEQAHRYTRHLYPTSPSAVLDIGSGTGRDAVALSALGHRVLAVEPTAELRAIAQTLHGGARVEWLDDGLPHLARVTARQEKFDLVLLTAVWMHLDVDERQIAMRVLASLMAPGGLIAMSLRHGPVPEGRRMFEVGYDETAALAAPHGLEPVFRFEGTGVLNPGTVTWTYLALRAR
jgi:SAM-dependent methyltransferase